MENVLRQAIAAYNTHGCRSNKKVSLIHEYIGQQIKARLQDHFKIKHLPASEHKIQGHFNKKSVDVCVLSSDDQVRGIVTVKFIMTNYQQNATNYFEQLAGEMLNFSSLPIKRWALSITFDKIPYLDKARNVKRYDTFKNKSAYDKLIELGYLDIHTLLVINDGDKLIGQQQQEPGVFTLQNPTTFESDLNAFVESLV